MFSTSVTVSESFQVSTKSVLVNQAGLSDQVKASLIRYRLASKTTSLVEFPNAF